MGAAGAETGCAAPALHQRTAGRHGVGPILLTLLSVLLLALVPACKGPPPPPPPAPRPPALRIVALAPALAVMLRDMGAGGLLVGRHGYDAWSDPALRVCGDQAGIDEEALVRANPTDVLLQWGEREIPARLEELAREHHWTVRSHPLLTLDDISSATAKLQGLAWGAGVPVPTIAATTHGVPGTREWFEQTALGARMAAAWSHREAPLARAGRVLLLHTASPIAALGPGSYHYQILQRIGGTAAITEGKPYMTLDVEDVLRLAPDAIVMIDPRPARSEATGPLNPDMVRDRFGTIGKLDIPAVRNNRLAIIDDPLGLVPGTNLIGTADDMAHLLEGWAKDGNAGGP